MQERLRTRPVRHHRHEARARLVALAPHDADDTAASEPADAIAEPQLADVVLLHPPKSSHTGLTRAPVRVLLAEDQALVRAGYRVLLESDELIEVAGEAASAEEAIACATATHPDVALLDPGLRGLDDPDAIARFLSHPAFAGVAVMLIASSPSDGPVLDALISGAVGVVEKDAKPSELIQAVRVVARGQALLPVSLARQVFSDWSSAKGQGVPAAQQLDELTEREREVVALVARGLTNPEIAAHLVISPATAKTHVSRAMLKIGASHRAQLVVLAYETGLVCPRSPGNDRPAAAQPAVPC